MINLEVKVFIWWNQKKRIFGVFFNEILDIYNKDMQNSVKQQIYTKLNSMPPWGQNVTP